MTSLYLGALQLVGHISISLFYYLCVMEMFGDLSAFEVLLVGAALVGAWVKYQVDYSKINAKFITFETKVEARISSIEEDGQEAKSDLKHILKDIQEIKLLLAKNKLE